jgi:hypothetical protein
MRIAFIRASRARRIRAILDSSITLAIAPDRAFLCRRLLVQWIGFLCIAVALAGCTLTQEESRIPSTTANQVTSATVAATAESGVVGTSLSFATIAQR